MNKYAITLVFAALLIGCGKGDKTLPIMGERIAVERDENGKKVVDTIYHSIPDFSLINQDSNLVDQNTVKGKVYVADFFFTSCPTICPKVRKNLKKVSEHFKGNDNLVILSHSIDAKYDTVGRLAWYAQKMNIDSKQWHLLTGDKTQIYELARKYLISAVEDKNAEGGFDHSSTVTLVDRQRRIRGLYDGLDAEKMEQLIKDIELLFKIDN